MEKYGFVYIWRDRKHKRYYIGAHWGTETDGYICSSNWMRDAYRRRPKDFKRRIMVSNISSRKELFETEYRFLSTISPGELGTKYYNLFNHKFSHWSETRTISSNKGRVFSEETRKKMSQAQLGNTNKRGSKLSIESREKMSQARKGIASPNKGIPCSEETKKKISEACRKFAQSNPDKFKGRPCYKKSDGETPTPT
jgi:hypothetical protein